MNQLTTNIQNQLGLVRAEYAHMQSLGYLAVRERAHSIARMAMHVATLPKTTKVRANIAR